MPMIGKALSFLFELNLVIGATLDSHRFKSFNSSLSCKTLVDEHVGAGKNSSKKTSSRAQAVQSLLISISKR